jgi:hypothetical protein
VESESLTVWADDSYVTEVHSHLDHKESPNDSPLQMPKSLWLPQQERLKLNYGVENVQRQ